MTLRYRYDPTDPEVVAPAPPPADETIEQRRKRRRAEFEKLPTEQRPPYALDPDRWRRILRAAIDGPITMGDLHRAVRLPGEPNTLAKFRTRGKALGLQRAGKLVWSPGNCFQTTPLGLQALADVADGDDAEAGARSEAA